MQTARSRFSLYAWSVLAFQLAVIVWGAFVRASGSGAGCGEHWPLCNGEVIPKAALNATLIEFAHRVTSGLAVITVAVLVFWAFRAFPRGYGVRGGSLLTLLSILIESAIGAALVLLRLVGSNESVSRGLWLGAHLINTLFLLAALSITAWQAMIADREAVSGVPRLSRRILVLSMSGFVAAGILGTFAALGDTLTAPASFTAGLQADFSSLSNIFVRVRILHPILAAVLGLWLIVFALRTMSASAVNSPVRRLSGAVAGLVLCQFALGIANIALKTPTPIQLTHLLVGDLLWIVCVLLAVALRPFRHPDLAPRIEPTPAFHTALE